MSPVVISLTCLGRPMQCRLPPAGGQDKPSLSAWPSPVVPQGQHVTLQCRSHHKFDTFRMYKDNGILVSKLHSVMSQKGFLIGPVTPTQAGTYRCCGPCPGSSSVWSAPSDPLVIVVAAQRTLSMNSPRAIKVEYGIQVIKQVTLSRYLSRRRHHGGSHANFSMGPATAAHGGTCRCFSSFNRSFHEWSAPSDPLDIMITGETKPSLWAQPGAVVRSGENVTFSCCSESSFDVYQLSRDEQPHECWLAKGQRRGGESQADFPLGPAHSALGGTYRCHGSFNRSPCEWSGPSDPLYISITDGNRLSLDSHLPTGNPRHLHVLAGPLVAIVFLAVLLFVLTRQWCPAKESESPEEASDPQAEDPQEVIDTQSDHCISTWKKTTPTFQRPEESLRDDSVYVELSYAPSTHRKMLRRLSVDPIALSETPPNDNWNLKTEVFIFLSP
uniref:Killer cell immunoglobulin-like receptor 3DL3 n=1 Tax=Ailuropoda melanoleuca TaxID=9646 RepID=A0A7N5P4G1_AILME